MSPVITLPVNGFRSRLGTPNFPSVLKSIVDHVIVNSVPMNKLTLRPNPERNEQKRSFTKFESKVRYLAD